MFSLIIQRILIEKEFILLYFCLNVLFFKTCNVSVKRQTLSYIFLLICLFLSGPVLFCASFKQSVLNHQYMVGLYCSRLNRSTYINRLVFITVSLWAVFFSTTFAYMDWRQNSIFSNFSSLAASTSLIWLSIIRALLSFKV